MISLDDLLQDEEAAVLGSGAAAWSAAAGPAAADGGSHGKGPASMNLRGSVAVAADVAPAAPQPSELPERFARLLRQLRPRLSLLQTRGCGNLTGDLRHKAESTCWLEPRRLDREMGWQFVCSTCSALRGSAAAVSFPLPLRSFNLLRHQRRAVHIAGVHRWLGLSPGAVGPPAGPSLEAFAQVWDMLRRGTAVDKGLDGVGSAKKLSKMRWCISEALRRLDRKALGNAKCISLSRDERDGRLSIRYSAADAELNRRRRWLGQARGFGTGAAAITEATATVIRLLATPGYGAPGHDRSAAVCDAALADHIFRHIESVTVDAASDEVLSGELIRGGGLRGSAAAAALAITPNLRFILRDKTHGARRHGLPHCRLRSLALLKCLIPALLLVLTGDCGSCAGIVWGGCSGCRPVRLTSRAWAADPFLNRVYRQYITSRDSLVSTIENSNLLSDKFQHYVRRSQGVYGIQVSNLSLARHRADSTQKPLARMVLFIDALLCVALHLSNSRGGREAQIGETFLQLSAEDYLQLSMMADAGDEAIQLVRLCDTECFDPATTPSQVGAFRARIKHLFVDRGCLELRGFTAFALDILSTQRVFTSKRGLRATFGFGPGGVPADLLQRCLGRMHGWCVIASSVLEAEFPSFEVLQSFSVFSQCQASVGIRGGSSRGSDFSPEQRAHIERLAETFGVDAQQLLLEIADHWPLAAAAMQASGRSSQDSWRSAVQSTRATQQRQQTHPSNALAPVLLRWLTLVCTNSAVEQGFAKMLHASRAQQSRASPDAEADTAKCVLDWDAAEEPAVLEGARQVWADFYGAARRRDVRRLDRGARRRLEAFDERRARNTEIAFLRARRTAVAEAASSAGICGGGGDGAAGIPLPDQWAPEQAAEVEFQQNKRQKRLVQALREGALRQPEVTPELQLASDACFARELVAERRRQAAQRQIAALAGVPGRQPQPSDLRGSAVWVAADIAAECQGFLPAMRKLQMSLVKRRCQDRDSDLKTWYPVPRRPTD